MTVTKHEQHQGPDTEAAKRNSAIIHFIILLFHEKGLLYYIVCCCFSIKQYRNLDMSQV